MSTPAIPAHAVVTLPNDSSASVTPPNTPWEALPSKERNSAHEYTIPDGGLRAWCSVAGSFLFITCTFGWAGSFGVMETYYVEALLPSYSPSSISWIGSMQLFLLFGVGLLSGKFFDAHRVRVALFAGSIILVGCIFALSAVKEDQYYAVFLCQALGQGLGQGLIYLPSLALNSHHFKRKRAIAMGITISGSSIGGIIFPILLNNVVQSSGFSAAVRAAGYLVLGCLILANLLVSTNYNPNDKGLPKPSLFKFLRHDKIYVVCLLGAFFLMWGVFMIFIYMPLYAVTHGVGESLSFYTVTIINGASFFGRTVPNFIAYKTGPLVLIVPLMTICSGLVWVMFAIKSEGPIIGYCILYGFFSGGIFSLSAPMMATLCDDLSEYGTRLGGATMAMAVGPLTGLPISGALVGWEPPYTWWKAIIFSGCTMGFGTALLAWCWLLQWKKKGTPWV